MVWRLFLYNMLRGLYICANVNLHHASNEGTGFFRFLEAWMHLRGQPLNTNMMVGALLLPYLHEELGNGVVNLEYRIYASSGNCNLEPVSSSPFVIQIFHWWPEHKLLRPHTF